MLNVEEQTTRIEQLYRQLTGTEPKRGARPMAVIPPEVNPEQYVQENLLRLQVALHGLGAPVGTAQLPTVTPRVAVFETEQDWKCVVELPGVRKDEVAVQVTQGILCVSATRGYPGINGEATRPAYAETGPARFERAVPMPPFARFETAEARMENGLLIVKCAKDTSAVRRDLKVEVAA